MNSDVNGVRRKPGVTSRSRAGRARVHENSRRLFQERTRMRAAAEALVTVLARRLGDTRLHMWRVRAFSLRIAQELGLSPGQIQDLEMGALLHDVGKIEVPLAILAKAGSLTEEEWLLMKKHPATGSTLLRELEYSEGVTVIAGQHHEQWNGGGYPLALSGEQIELTARVFSVADAFDAITAERVYKPGRSYGDARDELERAAGSQFDPQVVEAFNRIPTWEWERLREGVSLAIERPGFSQAWASGFRQAAVA